MIKFTVQSMIKFTVQSMIKFKVQSMINITVQSMIKFKVQSMIKLTVLSMVQIQVDEYSTATTTCLPLSTLGAGHDEARVREVPLSILGGIDICPPALHLHAICTDGGVYGHCVGALRLLGRAVALDLPALGVAGDRRTAHMIE